MAHKHGGDGCPIETSLDVLGGKWKGMVLHRLLHGTLRFNELRRPLPRVSLKPILLMMEDWGQQYQHKVGEFHHHSTSRTERNRGVNPG